MAVSMVDDFGRKAMKTFQSIDISGADLGAEMLVAKTAADALIADLKALTELRVLFFKLGTEFTESDGVGTNANRDEGLTMNVEKADNKLAVMTVPAPALTIFDANGVLDITDALATDYVANFVGAAGWTVSDGELVTTLVSGRLDT